MKTRALKGPCPARRAGRLACIVLVFFCFVVPAWGQKDLLLMPAMKSRKAASSLLTDIVKADGRLVAVGERGHILYSDDNGKSWTQADVPVKVTLTAVDFPTARKGWAVGHDGAVLHSEDAGQTWHKQLDGKMINAVVTAQLKQMIQSQKEKLETAEQGAAGDPAGAGGEPVETLDETMDETLVETLAEDLENLEFALVGAEEAVAEGPTRPLMDLWFKNDREGIVIGSFGLILETKDGGVTWNPLLDRMDNPEGGHYYGITRSGNDLFIAGEAGILFRSEDFGQTWKRLESPYDGSFFGILGSPEGGFVVAFGLRGSTFYSHDRGENWIEANKDGAASLSGAAFLSDGSLWIAGVDGAVLRSVDRGKTFKTLPTRFPGIISLTETGDGNVVLVGLRGATRIEVCEPGQ
jgi:photosystem II stability/assembly factor-like uncharacterized protein